MSRQVGLRAILVLIACYGKYTASTQMKSLNAW